MGRFFFIAKRFIAGESIETAVIVVKALNQLDLDVTLNLLGEGIKQPEQAESAVQNYIAVLDKICDEDLRANISLKLTHLGLNIDEEKCLEHLCQILEAAKERNLFVRLDMEGSLYTQQTLDIFYSLVDSYSNAGVVIQAMLLRSPHDIFVLNKIGASVRLCKGSYREPSELAVQKMPNIRSAYLSMAEQLLKDGNYPAFATHDDYLIDKIISYAEELGISSNQFEFQMLLGLRPNFQQEISRRGYRMRIYVPCGPEWMNYFYRRIRGNRENLWFVLRNLIRS